MGRTKKEFPWGLWALIGFVGWIVLMLTLGSPTLVWAAPAAGVICGWILGGLFNLALTIFSTSRRGG